MILQALAAQFGVVPPCWTQTDPPYEAELLIQRENDIFPVEVKSEANTASKGLKRLKELLPDKVKLRARCAPDKLKPDGAVLNIPLLVADHTGRLIARAFKQMGSIWAAIIQIEPEKGDTWS